MRRLGPSEALPVAVELLSKGQQSSCTSHPTGPLDVRQRMYVVATEPIAAGREASLCVEGTRPTKGL